VPSILTATKDTPIANLINRMIISQIRQRQTIRDTALRMTPWEGLCGRWSARSECRLYRNTLKTEIAFIGRFASKSALASLYDKELVVL